jgi:hypothetical protein
MLENSTNQEKWIWRFIGLMILCLLAYLPYVIYQNGSFSTLLTQVQHRVTTSGAQIESVFVNPFTGVLDVSVIVNTPELGLDLQYDSNYLLQHCFSYDGVRLCDEENVSGLIIQQNLSKLNRSYLLPDGANDTVINYNFSLIDADQQVISSLSAESIIDWIPNIALKYPRGEYLQDSDKLLDSSVYIAESRSTDTTFELNGVPVEAQKMVKPDVLREFQRVPEIIALHTWLLVIPEVELGAEFCVIMSSFKKCISVMTEESVSHFDSSDSDEESIEITNDLIYLEPMIEIVTLNKFQSVLIVYFVQSDQTSSAPLFAVQDQSGADVFMNIFYTDSLPSTFIKVKNDQQYFLSTFDESSVPISNYLIDPSRVPFEIQKLSSSAESDSILSFKDQEALGSISFEWIGSDEIFYISSSQTFVSTDTYDGIFNPVLTLRSFSDTQAEVSLQFPDQNLKINEVINPNETKNIPLSINSLDYGHHQILFELSYDDGLKSAPIDFSFEFKASSSISDKEVQKLLYIVIILIFAVIIFGYLYRRQTGRSKSQ